MDRCPRPQVISCFYLAQFTLVIAVFLELAAQTFAADPAGRFHSDPVYFSGDGFLVSPFITMVYL